MKTRTRQQRSHELMEVLEPRTLLSASYAVLVMQAPNPPARPVQTDHSATPSLPDPDTLGLGAALDLQVRSVPGGVYITVAASSTQVMALAPTGTVDLYENSQFLGTVQLGVPGEGGASALRSIIVLPAGPHTIFATYFGDANFGPALISADITLAAPTATRPAHPPAGYVLPTNSAGERIRPQRALSNIDFFQASHLTVGTIPPSPSGNNQNANGTVPSGPATPSPRFAKVSFSVKPTKSWLPWKTAWRRP